MISARYVVFKDYKRITIFTFRYESFCVCVCRVTFVWAYNVVRKEEKKKKREKLEKKTTRPSPFVLITTF